MRSTQTSGLLRDGTFEEVERCGLLRGRGHKVTCADEVANVASDRRTAFEIDPAALIRAYKLERAGGLTLLGFYHTHPSGSAEPSVTDAEMAAPDGKLWLIATGGHALLWRAVEKGSVHGRFDPVRFDIKIGTRVVRDVPGVQHVDVGRDYVALVDPEMLR